MDSTAGILGFLSIFHILGGIGLGYALRQILARQLNPLPLFFIIWGSMFGGLPLIMGIAAFTASGQAFLIPVELLTFVGPILIVAFTPQEYLASFASAPFFLTVIGLVFLIVGAVMAYAISQQQLLLGCLFGGIFILAGALAAGAGIKQAFQNR